MGNADKIERMRSNLRLGRLIRIWIGLGCFLAALSHGHAFKLSPITKEFTPDGRGSSQAFQLENDSDQTVAVQVSMLTREMQLDGSEINLPADDDFAVFPSQILLRAGQVQTVRVQWAGTDNPPQELSYRILAEQLPVNFTREPAVGAKINVVIRYLGSVYIVPPGAKSDVAIESVVPTEGQNNEALLEVTFHNRGTAHTILRDLKLTLKVDATTVELDSKALSGIAGENLLAGAKRRFVLPRPAELPEGPVEVDFHFNRRR